MERAKRTFAANAATCCSIVTLPGVSPPLALGPSVTSAFALLVYRVWCFLQSTRRWWPTTGLYQLCTVVRYDTASNQPGPTNCYRDPRSNPRVQPLTLRADLMCSSESIALRCRSCTSSNISGRRARRNEWNRAGFSPSSFDSIFLTLSRDEQENVTPRFQSQPTE